MNFDVYEINKIFFDNIAYMPQRKKYGFSCWKQWDGPRFENIFDVFLTSGNVNWRHYTYSPFKRLFHLKYRLSFYKIDQNYLKYKEHNDFYFMIYERDAHISLRELILFMIYMKYLSSSCV